MAYTTINKSTDYFNTTLRNGAYNNSGTTTDITVGFQPDLVWNKVRDRTGDHDLIDSVRGAGYTIKANLTNTQAGAANLTSFLSNGFQLTNNNDWSSTNTLVDWSWKAGGTASSNTDGSITSTVSANTVAGFSIVKYTGTGAIGTVGHGLGVAPKMIIAKGLAVDNNWIVYHSTVGNTKGLALQDTTDFTGSHLFNNTSPTSSVFSLGAVGATNSSGDENIAYCFAEKTGYSKIGSYTGNGNADGAFVYTGFKPAFILIRRTDSGDNWLIHDNKREGYNPANDELMPNLNNAEQAYDTLDIVSNGFKLRHSAGRSNNSGGTYIYYAVGQSLVGSNNVPCTAR